VWKFSRWVTILHPEGWDVLFNTDVGTGQFNYWDLHHSGASAAVLPERLKVWEAMTMLSQDK
jgi:hypothetical protein